MQHVLVKVMEHGVDLHQRVIVSTLIMTLVNLQYQFIAHTAVVCPLLENPSNGNVSMTGGVYQDTVTYTCNNGFQLSGDPTRTCGSDGQWSGSAPTCDRKYNLQYNLVIHCVDLLPTQVSRVQPLLIPWVELFQ